MRNPEDEKARCTFGNRQAVIQNNAAFAGMHVAPEHQMHGVIPREPVIQMDIAVAEKIGDIGVVVPYRRLRECLLVFRQPIPEFEIQEEV